MIARGVDNVAYGQNIAAGTDSAHVSDAITDEFYNGEEPLYTYYNGEEPDMDGFESWGHFTQLVWAGTQQVGCFTYDCSDHPNGLVNFGTLDPYFTVCNYSPPGKNCSPQMIDSRNPNMSF